MWASLTPEWKSDEAQLEELAEELDLHELAVEDALSEHQRPKVDYYESHLFLSCHSVRVDSEANGLETTEIDAFIGKQWMITVRKNDAFSMDPVVARWDRSSDLVAHGVGFLLYGLLDIVIDGYFDAVRAFDDYYDTVSEGRFAEVPLTQPTAKLVRNAARPGAFPSVGGSDARGSERTDASRPT